MIDNSSGMWVKNYTNNSNYIKHYGKKGMHWGERHDYEPVGNGRRGRFDQDEINARRMYGKRAGLRTAGKTLGVAASAYTGYQLSRAIRSTRDARVGNFGKNWLKVGAGAAALGVSLALLHKSKHVKPVESYRDPDGSISPAGKRYVKSYDTYVKKQQRAISEANRLVRSNRKLSVEYGGTASGIRDYDAFDKKLKKYKVADTTRYKEAKKDAVDYANRHYASILEGRQIAMQE